MYRPDNWKNPYSVLPEHMEREYPVPIERTAYEAGADAMLEELKKDGYNSEHCGAGDWIETCAGKWNEKTEVHDGLAGTWVFIPDEQVKKDE